MAETPYNLAIDQIRDGFIALAAAKGVPIGEMEIVFPDGRRHIQWLGKPTPREWRIDIKLSLDERSA